MLPVGPVSLLLSPFREVSEGVKLLSIHHGRLGLDCRLMDIRVFKPILHRVAAAPALNARKIHVDQFRAMLPAEPLRLSQGRYDVDAAAIGIDLQKSLFVNDPYALPLGPIATPMARVATSSSATAGSRL